MGWFGGHDDFFAIKVQRITKIAHRQLEGEPRAFTRGGCAEAITCSGAKVIKFNYDRANLRRLTPAAKCRASGLAAAGSGPVNQAAYFGWAAGAL